MSFLFPPRLKEGDSISVVAPSSPFKKNRFLSAKRFLQDRGFKVSYEASLFNSENYLAGSDRNRRDMLVSSLFDSKTSAVWAARGGYGLTRVFSELKLFRRKKFKKLFIGLSDLTPFLNWMAYYHNVCTVHGPVLAGEQFMDLSDRKKKKLLSHLMMPVHKTLNKGKDYKVLRKGQARGRLWGGNLSMLEAMISTPYEIPYSGGVLFLEEVNEPEYRIDRMICHLAHSKRLVGIRGLVLGDFTKPNGKFHSQAWLKDLFTFYFKKKPILSKLKAGHVNSSVLLPIGAPVKIVDQGKQFLLPALVS